MTGCQSDWLPYRNSFRLRGRWDQELWDICWVFWPLLLPKTSREDGDFSNRRRRHHHHHLHHQHHHRPLRYRSPRRPLWQSSWCARGGGPIWWKEGGEEEESEGREGFVVKTMKGCQNLKNRNRAFWVFSMIKECQRLVAVRRLCTARFVHFWKL